MAYQLTSMRAVLRESTEKAMDALDRASSAAGEITDTSDRAEVLAEIGQGYALLAQAAAEAMDEVA